MSSVDSILPGACTVTDADGNPCGSCEKPHDIETQILTATRLVACLKQAEDKLYSLEVERIGLKTAINHSHDLINRRLPLEIAWHIFEIYVDMHDFRYSKGGLSDADAPLRLGAVCRAWREIAWSFPPLWTTMAVDMYCEEERINMPTLVTQWLARTGTLPLSICLKTYDYFSDDEHTERALSIISVIKPAYSRWQSLTLDMPPDLVESVCSAYDSRDASLLRRLDISFDRSMLKEDLDDILFPTPLFTGSNHVPSPTHISISGISLDEIHIKWMNVTNFEADQRLPEQCLEVFRWAPCLTVCALHSVDETTDDNLFEAPITSPNLRTLALSDIDWTPRFIYGVKIILDNLITPSLERYEYYGNMLDLDSLFSFIDRSACSLKHLLLTNQYFAPKKLIRLLQITPSLETLELRNHMNTNLDYLFKYILGSMQSNLGLPFLPKLQTLITTVDWIFPWSIALDLIESAHLENTQGAAPTTKLRQSLKVRLVLNDQGPPRIDEQTRLRLLNLRAQGIHIIITYLNQIYE